MMVGVARILILLLPLLLLLQGKNFKLFHVKMFHDNFSFLVCVSADEFEDWEGWLPLINAAEPRARRHISNLDFEKLDDDEQKVSKDEEDFEPQEDDEQESFEYINEFAKISLKE
jgi:hypothetical protein